MRGWGYGMGKGRKLEEKMLILSSFYRKCFYRLRNQIGMKAMQVRAVIIANEEVQRVGYRDVVEIKRGDMTEELVERFDIARGVINAKT